MKYIAPLIVVVLAGVSVPAHGQYVNAYVRSDSSTTNTAMGLAALPDNGNGNTAIGEQAMESNAGGDYNTATGYQALVSNTTGADNTANGLGALTFNTTGVRNTASGSSALFANVTGSGNIAVGYQAGSAITLSNNIDIGHAGVATDNGVIRLGTKGVHKQALIAGIYNTPLMANSLPVYVNVNGRLSVGTSSERYKTAIAPMERSTDKLAQLRPVTFQLKNDPKGALQYGLIAEEVAKVYPELVVRDESGQIQGVRYDELAPMLLNEVQRQANAAQRQANELQHQTDEIQRQDRTIAAQGSQLRDMQKKLTELEAALRARGT